MNNFKQLITLYNEEVKLLQEEQTILTKEGYDTSDINQRIKKLNEILDYCTLNPDTIVSITQINQIFHYPVSEPIYNPSKVSHM